MQNTKYSCATHFLLHTIFSPGERILSFGLKILPSCIDEEGIRICSDFKIAYREISTALQEINLYMNMDNYHQTILN